MAGIEQLKRTGDKITGLCPLPGHNEKTPSWVARLDRQSWKCYGCHEYGDQIDLVAKSTNRSNSETIKILADTLGISTDLSRDQREKIKLEIKKREHDKAQEVALKKVINDEYLRLVNIESWVHIFWNHIYDELDLKRPAVAWALKTRPQVEYYLDEFLRGTWTERLEMVAVTRGWNPWASF